MTYMTELEERLAAQDAGNLRKDIQLRLESLTKRLRQRMAEQLQTQEEFRCLTLLASAGEMAQKVIGDVDSLAPRPLMDSSPH